MSHSRKSPGLFARAPRRGARGFTLIEIIVSITLLAIAAAAIVPLLITAAQAAATGKYQTEAKALGQQRIEHLRNLQYHVDFSAGPYVDLLDTYYSNNQTAASPGTNIATAGTGFVASGATRYTTITNPSGSYTNLEPAGEFYRYVVPQSQLNLPLFYQFVDTQFLGNNGAPTTFPAGAVYNNQATGTDTPLSNTLSVTVITTWKTFGHRHVSVLTTQISGNRAVAPTIVASAKATVLHATTTLNDNTQLIGDVALSSSSGTLDNAARADGEVTAVGAVQSGGPSTAGGSSYAARQILQAPPAVSLSMATTNGQTNLNDSSGTLAGCNYICYRATQTCATACTATAVNGLANTGSSAAPLTAEVLPTSNGGFVNRDFYFFDKGLSGVASNLGLLPGVEPVVSLRETSSGSADAAKAQSYATSTFTTPLVHDVTTSATAASQVIDVLPTNFTATFNGRDAQGAPTTYHGGLLEITINSASLTCAASNAGATAPSGNWSARVDYWNGAAGAYQLLGNVGPGSSDPLAGKLATAMVQPGVPLSTYFSSLASAYQIDTSGTSAVASDGILNGLVSLSTRPLNSNPASAIQVIAGQLSCHAEDTR